MDFGDPDLGTPDSEFGHDECGAPFVAVSKTIRREGILRVLKRTYGVVACDQNLTPC